MVTATAALHGIRVLDFTDATGDLAGRVLADLGAEVICVEPPDGSASRRLPPFIAADGARDVRSLWWETTAVGKKSVTADIDRSDDRDRLLQLIDSADVLIESFAPGRLTSVGLGAQVLAERNPDLIYAAISPFGQDGPKHSYPANDLVLQAAGGLLGMQGDGDRPPVPVGLPQAGFHAGVQAAADIVIALYARDRGAGGQVLDVSTQAAVVWTLMNATGYPTVTGANPPGFCEQRANERPPPIPGMRPGRLLRCADGYVVIGLHLPGVGERTMAGAVRWMVDTYPSLIKDPRIAEVDWLTWMNRAREGLLPIDTFNAAYDALALALAKTTKTDLLTLAVRDRLLIAPVLTTADVRNDAQLAERDFWTSVGDLTLPGAFAKLSKTPIQLDGPAPTLGAHQHLLDDIQPPAPHRKQSNANGRAFSGLKVADFAWVGVGPIMSKALADHGAQVAHIESSKRPDVLRAIGPFKDNEPGQDRSQFFANFNTNKRSIDLDFNNPDDLATAHALADWADVVVESFVPGTMAKYGLDYATLSANKPDLVMLSTCMRGQTGPQKTYGGFGNQGAALAGLFSVTGWPDRPPTGPWGAYTDFIAPRYGLAALAAALLHRSRTGVGQYIDLSQIEAGIQFMAPLIADYTVNGRVAEPAGHHSLYAYPHGVYAARGKERYVALAVTTDTEWRALHHHILPGQTGADWGEVQRRSNEAVIHRALTDWFADRDPFEAETLLARAGVPAHVVMWPSDLHEDPQLRHRDFFQPLHHAEMGEVFYDGHVTQFSRTPPKLETAGPCLGADRDEVLSWLDQA